MSWVFNTAVTIIVCSVIFYALDLNLVMGVIIGVLLAMVSNLHLTLSRVTRASRWEVYKNRVVVPMGFRGGERTIEYSDIARMERHRGMAGESVVLHMTSDESITFDLEEQRRPIEALELAFRQYDRSRSGGRGADIQIPISRATDLD